MKVIYDNKEEVEYSDIYEMFFENLKERKINFNMLSQRYVDYLQMQETKHIKQICEADIPLAEVFSNDKHNSTEDRMCYIARYLVKYERYKGTPFYNNLLRFVAEKNINLNGSYYVDMFKKGE